MTDREFFNLKIGDRIESSDGIIRTIKGTQITKIDWLHRPKRMTFLVSFNNDWPDFVYSYERGSNFSSWKIIERV